MSMNDPVASAAALARLYVHRAADAADAVAARLPGTQLSREDREELAADVASVLTRFEWLLRTLGASARPHEDARAQASPG